MMMIRNNAAAILVGTLVVALTSTTLVSSTCIIEGDIAIPEGGILANVSLSCLNETHYTGQREVCTSDGGVNYIPDVWACPTEEGTPYCVQCGTKPSRRGGALCSKKPTLSSDLDCSIFTEDYDDAGCLTGPTNVAVPFGRPIQLLDRYCPNPDNTSPQFMEYTLVCGRNGYGEGKLVLRSCEELSPNMGTMCVEGECAGALRPGGDNLQVPCEYAQPGEPCVETGGGPVFNKPPVVGNGGDGMNGGGDEEEGDPHAEEGDTDGDDNTCDIGDGNYYFEDDLISHQGYECLTNATYDGIEKVCGPGGQPMDVYGPFRCPPDAPVCVQCDTDPDYTFVGCVSIDAADVTARNGGVCLEETIMTFRVGVPETNKAQSASSSSASMVKGAGGVSAGIALLLAMMLQG